MSRVSASGPGVQVVDNMLKRKAGNAPLVHHLLPSTAVLLPPHAREQSRHPHHLVRPIGSHQNLRAPPAHRCTVDRPPDRSVARRAPPALDPNPPARPLNGCGTPSLVRQPTRHTAATTPDSWE